jgi:hypothetical protein
MGNEDVSITEIRLPEDLLSYIGANGIVNGKPSVPSF